MELPKDVVQVGEPNPNCKVYVEDYVVSFIKQQNRKAVDKTVAVALYGSRRVEEGKVYVFVYGAGILDSLRKETRHLSQAQSQEMENLREKYFPGYETVGYRLLNGEMIDGMHICDHESYRYIPGYAQFYQKNELMLAYMLDYKGNPIQPEVVDQEKYEMVKKRQEERRLQNEDRHKGRKETRELYGQAVTEGEKDGISESERDELKEAWSDVFSRKRRSLRRMQLATVAVFAVLCVVGLYSVGGMDSFEEVKASFKNAMVKLSETPEASGEIPVAGGAVTGESARSILRTDEKLSEAIRKENQAESQDLAEGVSKDGEAPKEGQAENRGETTGKEEDSQGDVDTSDAQNPEKSDNPYTDRTEGEVGSTLQDSRQSELDETGEGSEADTEQEGQAGAQGNQEDGSSETELSRPVEYTIKKGDTLMEICLREYGNTTMLWELCKQNHIQNPDNIKVGQKILLP